MMNNDDISVKAVELLFTKQRRTFLNLAMSMVHDAEIAEDILHDSFISLWEKRESVNDFIDYLYITIRNNCLRYRRDTSIHKAVYDKIAQKEQGLMEIYTRTIENCDVANLHEGVSYKAVVYSDDLDAPMVTQPDGTDAPDKAAYLIRKEILSSDDTLILSLASDGGAAVSFIPIK